MVWRANKVGKPYNLYDVYKKHHNHKRANNLDPWAPIQLEDLKERNSTPLKYQCLSQKGFCPEQTPQIWGLGKLCLDWLLRSQKLFIKLNKSFYVSFVEFVGIAYEFKKKKSLIWK